jgi:hypothetical protein
VRFLDIRGRISVRMASRLGRHTRTGRTDRGAS